MEAAIHLAHTTGVVLRREAVELGIPDAQLTYAVRHGLLRRIRQGAYVLPERWDRAFPEEKHRLLCEAVRRQHRGAVAFTHASSLVLQGISVWGVDLTQVHIFHLGESRGRTQCGLVHHWPIKPKPTFVQKGDYLVSEPAQAVVENLTLVNAEGGLVAADSALHHRLITKEELWDAFDQRSLWPGIASGRIVVPMADGRAESVGESRGRMFCFQHFLPPPELQFKVFHDNGHVIGITDFAWHEERVFGEFDGRIKYGRLLKPGQDIVQVVEAEKNREDAIRDQTGYRCLRWTWSEYNYPEVLEAKFRRRLGRRAA